MKYSYAFAVLLFTNSTFAAIPNDVSLNDWTGRVQIHIRNCPATPLANHPVAICDTPSTGGLMNDGFVVVGGGGWVVNDVSPGAMLVSSFPDDSSAPNNLKSWIVSSKDQKYPYLHSLQAFSIGISLQGISAASLRQNANIRLFPQTNGPTNHPHASAAVDAGYTLIGGGVKTTYSGWGVMLTDSHLQNGQWYGASKDHVEADGSGVVTVYAIGIRTQLLTDRGLTTFVPSAPTGFCVDTGFGTSQTPPGAPTGVKAGFVLTAAGGQAQYNGFGRLLTAIWPFYDDSAQQQAVWVESVDHEKADSGCTLASFIAIGGA